MKIHKVNVNDDIIFNIDNGIEHYLSTINKGYKIYQFKINYDKFGTVLLLYN